MVGRVKAMSWMFSGAGVALGVPALAGALFTGWHSLRYLVFPPYRIGGPFYPETIYSRSGYLTRYGVAIMHDLFLFSAVVVAVALALFYTGAWLRLGLHLGKVSAAILLVGLFGAAAYGGAIASLPVETGVCCCTAGLALLGLWQLRAA
jgi:hypothetical protein